MLRGGGSLAHQVLLELQDGQWVCVGSYVEDTINLEPHVRRKGLGQELVLRCAEHRQGLPFTTGFSEAGYRLLKKTHKLAVERAQAAGLNVPQKVLDELKLPES
jgi:hypothetical protein